MKKITLQTNIRDIGLSNRVLNALENAQIITVGQMLKLTDQDLFFIPGLGTKDAVYYDKVTQTFYPDFKSFYDNL